MYGKGLLEVNTWTEILAEDACLVHVGDQKVLCPLAKDISQVRVRELKEYIEHREAHKRQLEEQRKLGRVLDRELALMERLNEADVDVPRLPQDGFDVSEAW